LAGLFSKAPAPSGALGERALPLKPLTILFGSQTGNAENLAKRVAKEAGKHGFAPTIVEMAQYKPAGLASEQHLLLITSTYGDGEPPDNARAFWKYLSDNTPSLANVKFSVLALGDSNYAQFCQCGKQFDARLEQLGAQRIHARVDCDVDFEDNFRRWLAGVLAAFGAGTPAMPAPETAPLPADDEPQPAYHRKRPFPARLTVNRKLNGTGSEKDTRHFVISLEGSGLSYAAGDALGVWPTNSPERVDEFLRAIDCNGDADAVRAALVGEYELARVPVPAQTLAAPDFFATLKKLQPRLYSIASSPKVHPNEVHLCVAVVRGQFPGVCSTFLADRVTGDAPVPVFVHANPGFRPPGNGDAPMIMIGPGTGIAPFRAFLQERQATGARGRNWLFFGDQRAAVDFLFREELETIKAGGLLTRLDTAFSRDQAEKVYVQHRMLEQAKELFAWLEDGAHLYVCGDAKRMAKDVDAALRAVIRKAGNRSLDEANEYVDRLQAARRYQRDVY
jgi:sulfite reductase (NADPH) flavoprotein alpha-component